VSLLGNDEANDTSIFTNLYLKNIYDLGERGAWTLENIGLLYGKLNNTFTDNNLLYVSLGSQPTYTYDRYKIGFPLTFSQVYLSGIKYSHLFKFGLEGTYLLDTSSNIFTSLAYEKTLYRDDNDLDVNAKVATLKYKKAFGKNPFFLSLETSYKRGQKIRGTRTDVTNNTWTNKISIAYEIYKNILTSASYTYKDIKYKETDVLFQTNRKDTQNLYTVGLNYALSKTSFLSAQVGYKKQTSNQAPFTYNKTTATLNYTKSF